jgi:hypothetical protein
MLKIKKYLNAALMLCACLFLQSCSIPLHWLMVTNTKSGNLCIEDMHLSVDDPYVQQVAKIIYARYGLGDGDHFAYSSDDHSESGCMYAESPVVPKANLIISFEFYKYVIEPEYLGTVPQPTENTTL